ncbi:MAG: C1 family peptidase [Sandaracinaceae bacterium]
MSGAWIGQMVGRQVGSYLGRQIALGACREDRDDQLARRVFTPRVASSQLPSAVDLRPWLTPVEDQGRLGSCAANALVGGLEYLVRRETGQHVDLSRVFVYFNQRLWDDCVRDDLGASLGDGVRVLSRLGAPTERTWPYHPDLFAVQPPEAVYTEARAFRAVDWWAVPVDPDAFRGCLAAGFPIAFGTKVTESFVRTSRSGECGMPSGADDRRHGRHALLAVGYDDRRRVFVVRNSWGADWGDRGYVYMPYDYVLNRAWTRGCWALRLTRREAFEPARFDGARVPKAPPGGGSGGTRAAGSIASVAAQVGVGAFTGSGLLGGLAGGLISGLTPGVSKALRGRDRGAYLDVDRGDAILAALEADDPERGPHLPWDDGLDEEARVASIGEASARRRVAASGAAALAAPAAAAPRSPMPRKAAPRRAPVSPPPPAPPPKPAAPPVEVRERWDLVESLPPDVREPWRAAGAMSSPLGTPTARAEPMGEGAHRGHVARFANGWVCAWRGAPPLVLPNAAPTVASWVALGAGRSVVGWPIAAPQPTPDGAGSILACTRGSILAHPAHGAHPVHGMIFGLWRSLGGLTSDLGWPVADPELPEDPSAPQRLRFEHGVLAWSAERGAYRE